MNAKNKFIPFSPPWIGEEEIREVVDTLRSDWITTGPKTRRFEEEFRKFVKADSALALSSCTAGLHLALVLHGIRPGDAVITTPMTFCSGVNVIEQAGALPVLADVEPRTLNIDPEAVAKILKSKSSRKKIKAILAVHYAGHPCEMDALMKLADRYGLKIIEDAAHAVPAEYKGKKIGGLGNLTAFSFYGTKNLTTAEGGMLTGSPRLIEKARLFSLHGMNRDAWKRYSKEGSWRYDVVAPGFKYNMTDIQAALGLVQLRKLPGFQVRRREIVKHYSHAFSRFPELEIPLERPYVKSAWHLYVLRLNPGKTKISRDALIEELRRKGIGTSVHFIPIHLHSYYKKKYGFKPGDFPAAYREYQRLLSLPLYPRMTQADIERVIRAVSESVRGGKALRR